MKQNYIRRTQKEQRDSCALLHPSTVQSNNTKKINHLQRVNYTYKKRAIQELCLQLEQSSDIRVCVVGSGMMRKSRKTRRSVIILELSTTLSLRECFIAQRKQTASLSNYDYLAPVILRACSALYRLILKGWSQAHIVSKVCFKCFSVSSVLQVLSDLSQHQNR